jgi:hypothetical protein
MRGKAHLSFFVISTTLPVHPLNFYHILSINNIDSSSSYIQSGREVHAVIEITKFAMLLSLCMAILLIYTAYWEGIRIANENDKVNGLSFVFMSTLGFIFSLFASHFFDLI